MYFFTADEHYGHENIIRYCHRPFATVEKMNKELVRRHNDTVTTADTVIHAGDFAFGSALIAEEFIRQLTGNHIFLRGSHDRWLGPQAREIWEGTIEGQFIVVCHYAMRVWPRSHHNSWQLFGHSHGTLETQGKQWDIGVDSNDFAPLSFERIKRIMSTRPDNINLVPRSDKGPGPL